MDVEDILRKLVSINSVFENEEQISVYLESYLKKLGFKTRRQKFGENRSNVFAERGKGNSSILFYGHMDTVIAHGKWKRGPFELLKEGDKLYGLGAFDMKGGIAAMLKTLEQHRDRKIKVLLCGDEENISKGAWTAVKEKGWFRDVEFMISCEPGDSKRHNGGANVVTIGRRGRVVIEADVYGLSSHGANPQRGINAIDEASKIALAMNKFKLRSNRNLGAENIFVRKIVGNSESALDLPDKAHVEFDIQLVPPSTINDAKSRIQDVVNGLYVKGRLDPRTKVVIGVKQRDTPYIEPYIHDKSNPKVRKTFDIIRKNLREPVVNYGSSVADYNILTNSLGKPIVTIGPSGGNEHAPEEWTSLRSLRELVNVYGMILDDL